MQRARPGLAEDLGRFTGASALAELALRFSGEDTHPALFDNANKMSSFSQCTGIVVIRCEVDTCSFFIGVIAHTILRIGVVTMKYKYRPVRRIVFWR